MVASNEFTPAAIKPAISTEDIDKLDIRVGTIELVEASVCIPPAAGLNLTFRKVAAIPRDRRMEPL